MLDSKKNTFIFLSSRKVYKPNQNIFENSKLQPIDKDSKNKLISENLLKKKLKSKILILRISNVIGLKKNKNYRQIHKTFFDNYLDFVKHKTKVEYHDQFNRAVQANRQAGSVFIPFVYRISSMIMTHFFSYNKVNLFLLLNIFLKNYEPN